MDKKLRIQDDLYEFINGEWIEKAVIPEDRPSTGGFSELDQNVEKILMEDFAAFAKGEKTTDVECMEDAIRLYRKVLDEKRRNEDGIKPILPLLEKIKSITTMDQLNDLIPELLYSNAEIPLNAFVTTDMADSTKYSFVIMGPGIILPDVPYYDPANPTGQALLGVWSQMAAAILAQSPLSEEEQKLFLADTLAFDALIAKRVKTQVEWADYVKNHNPLPLEEAASYLAPFDFKRVLSVLLKGKLPEQVVAYDLRAIKEFKEYFNEANLRLYVHWSYVKTLIGATQYLSIPLATLGGTYRRALTGVAKEPSLEKQAYRAVGSVFSEPVGIYYGRTYFGEEAKKDVVDMVKKIIEKYKVRIAENKFLEQATKEKAILKLSTMVIKMGYPDKARDYFRLLKVDEKDSYYETMSKITKTMIEDNVGKLYDQVDRTVWAMPGHMVNACYNPSSNDITFPAAILQKPFYSIHQLPSENLGGIGAVIGHEISHAFDNNGAQFDEEGKLFQWWTPKDYENFKKLTQDMIEQFDGIPFHGGKVNGTLVVSENIADNGGMAVTLAIMHDLKDADFKAYFENWGRIWCMKAKEEYILLLLNNDVHSPAKLRANITPRNFPEWYETFNVTKDDEMYIPEEKRLISW